jgi:predicted SAM-dependent methyltransferase
MSERRLEIACGPSPRAGYEHNDINAAPHIDHVGAAQDLDFPDGTFVEVFGTGALEHLTYEQGVKFLRKALRWLTPGGEIYLDAPDMTKWLRDLALQNRSKSSVMTALNGWCRWPGDDHKSFWTPALVQVVMEALGYAHVAVTSETDRCGGPSKEDWHVCVRARRPVEDAPDTRDAGARANGWEP